MKNKLFVGNLSWKATEESLKPVFEAFGKVLSVKIVTDNTGRSKGFGFVEMSSEAEAEAAVQGLNEKPHLERNMRVSLAQERSERPAGGAPRREYRGGGGGDRGGDRGGNGGGRSDRGFGQRNQGW